MWEVGCMETEILRQKSFTKMVTCLHKAHRRGYITEAEFKEQYDFAFNIMNLMAKFKEKIN